MHLLSVAPRILVEAALWQSVPSRWVRFGPTVPVVPAAARVWHEAQPPTPVKTAFPSAALAAAPELELELVELAAPVDELAVEPGTPGWAARGGGYPICGFAFLL